MARGTKATRPDEHRDHVNLRGMEGHTVHILNQAQAAVARGVGVALRGGLDRVPA